MSIPVSNFFASFKLFGRDVKAPVTALTDGVPFLSSSSLLYLEVYSSTLRYALLRLLCAKGKRSSHKGPLDWRSIIEVATPLTLSLHDWWYSHLSCRHFRDRRGWVATERNLAPQSLNILLRCYFKMLCSVLAPSREVNVELMRGHSATVLQVKFSSL